MRRVKRIRTKYPHIIKLTQKNSRYYHNEDRDWYYPSTTYILDCYPKGKRFDHWLKTKTKLEAEKIQQEAKDKGSKIHHAIYDLLNGEEVAFDQFYWTEGKRREEPLTEDEWDAIISFRKWFENTDVEILESEWTTYSRKHNFAGTVDSIAKVDGKVTVLDWKTGNGIYDNYWLQVAAYMRALRENGKYNPTQTAILRVGTRHKNGFEPLKTKGWQESQKNFTLFKDIQDIWRDKKGKSQEKIKNEIKKTVPDTIKLNL